MAVAMVLRRGPSCIILCLSIAIVVHARSSFRPRDFLRPHNAVRLAVGAPPLMWNATLRRYAQAYAEWRAVKDCVFEHSDGPYGENLAYGYDTAAEAVAAWAAESNETKMTPCEEVTYNHYTQMVWRGTTAVGCSVAWCEVNQYTYIVCEYYPWGNVYGECPL